MMPPDEMPAWFAIAGGVASTITYFWLKFRAATSSDEGTDRPGR